MSSNSSDSQHLPADSIVEQNVEPLPPPDDEQHPKPLESGTVLFRPSVLGVDRAKKRLQALATQKRHLLAANSASSPTDAPSHPDKTAQDLNSPNSTSSPHSNTTDKNKKKTKKKALTNYERKYLELAQLNENSKLKTEEENMKEALVQLGIPLSLLPAGSVIKGIVSKPMPTRAMPPIRNFLDPEQIESLLNGTMSKSDIKRLKQEANKWQKNRHDDNTRCNEKTNHFNNDRNTFRSNRESQKKTKDRNSLSKSDSTKWHHTDSKRFTETKDGESNECGKSARKSISKSLSINSDALIVPEPDTFDLGDGIFPETAIAIEKSEANTFELDIGTGGSNKFLCNTFIPVDDKSSRVPRDFSDIPKKTQALEQDNSPPAEVKIINSNFSIVDPNIYYSPGMESSRDSSQVLPNLSNHQDSSNPYLIPLNLPLDSNSQESSIGRSFTIWDDIVRSCQPKKHFSFKCYKKTISKPVIEYCENTTKCSCKQKRSKSTETLKNNISAIMDQMSVDDVPEPKTRNSRSWYPTSNIALTGVASFNLISYWDTDDSSSNHSIPTKIKDTSKANESVLFDPSLFAINSLPNINFQDTLPYQDVNLLYPDKPKSINIVPPVSTSLDSEYEKFMEAVCIGKEDKDTKELSEKVESSNSFEDSIFEKLANKFRPVKSNKDQRNLDQFEKQTPLTKVNENASTVEHVTTENLETNISEQIPSPIIKNVDRDMQIHETESEKNNKKHLTSPKLDKKRKGHAKISSRRTKGKHKNSSKSHKQTSSSGSSSYSEDSDSDSLSSNSSKSDSSSSSKSNSSSSSSSDSSASSSSVTSADSSSSSESSLSSSDLSSSVSSDSSDSKKKSKQRIKKIRMTKKYQMLSKSKRKKMLLMAKAKELAKKMKNKRKRKKKLKEKLAKKKKEIDKPTPHIEMCNNGKSYKIVDQPILKSKRKAMNGSDEDNKKKKSKLSIEDRFSSSSSTSSSSSDSESSLSYENDNNRNEKKRGSSSMDDSSDYEGQPVKRTKCLTEFNEDTVANIKRENVSDDEFLPKKLEISTDHNQTPYRQQIVNANELQIDFLQGSQSQMSIKAETQKVQVDDNITIKNQSTLISDGLDESKNDAVPNESDDGLKKQFDSVEDFMITNTIKKNDLLQKNVKQNIENPSKDEHCWKTKVKLERKTRWGSPVVQVKETPPIIPENGLDGLTDIITPPCEELEDSNNKIYKIQTISSCGISLKDHSFNEEENYEAEYEAYNQENSYEEFEIKSSPRKLSLDDRINLVLQAPDESFSISMDDPPLNNSQTPPEKGILITSRTMRADPRINRLKRVCFADGYLPGQDSDSENEIIYPSNKNETSGKKIVRKCIGGHSYPCPESWPDYHPRWDRLPPPPPPPGSPPPDIFEMQGTVSCMTVNTIVTPNIPKITNILENLPVV